MTETKDARADEYVEYRQVNKDHAYWSEKRTVGELKGGHTCGLITHFKNGRPRENVLFDAGSGTIEGLCDLGNFTWKPRLRVFVSHSHPDHHAELMFLSELWCKRMAPKRRRAPLEVYCTGDRTTDTMKRLRNDYKYGFSRSGGNTLKHKVVLPGTPITPRGSVFTIHAIPNDHAKGAVNYVVTFGDHKIIIGWDIRTPPNPNVHTLLQQPSLALIEANTWSIPARPTGHTSVEDLVHSHFLRRLRVSTGSSQYGLYFVHYGGGEDPSGVMQDGELECKFRSHYKKISGFAGVARRGQRWRFPL